MPVNDLSQLRPETRAVVEEYLAALEAGFCRVSRPIAADALEEVRSHVLDALDERSGPRDAQALIDDLGAPDEYAIALCAAISGTGLPGEEDVAGAARVAEPRARVLGMPADFRAPTAANLTLRMWNPHDPRIFTPRLIGIGWTINFAALAIKLGIIRPDDEDSPFASTPERWLRVALALPVTLTLGTLTVVAALWGSLPPELPIHWDGAGTADGFATRGWALGPILVLMLATTAYALWAFVAGSSRTARALITALATMFTVLGVPIVAASVAYGRGVIAPGWWPYLMIVLAFAVPFVQLVVLSKRGHVEEIRRDLKL